MACTPNNPTGTILTAEKLAELVAGVPRDVVVLIDEAYLDSLSPTRGPATPLTPGQLPTRGLTDLPKAHALAGMRGYLCASWPARRHPLGVHALSGSTCPRRPGRHCAALGGGELACTAERSAAVAPERDHRRPCALRAGRSPRLRAISFWLGVAKQMMMLAEHFRGAGILRAAATRRVSVGTTSDNERVSPLRPPGAPSTEPPA